MGSMDTTAAPIGADRDKRRAETAERVRRDIIKGGPHLLAVVETIGDQFSELRELTFHAIRMSGVAPQTQRIPVDATLIGLRFIALCERFGEQHIRESADKAAR